MSTEPDKLAEPAPTPTRLPWMARAGRALALVAGLYGLQSAVAVVPAGGSAVRLRLGQTPARVGPGLVWLLPFGIDRLRDTAPMASQREELGFRSQPAAARAHREAALEDEAWQLTADGLLLEARWTVLWRPAASLAPQSAEQQRLRVRDAAEAAMSGLAGQRRLWALLDADRAALERDLLAETLAVLREPLVAGRGAATTAKGATTDDDEAMPSITQVQVISLRPAAPADAVWQAALRARREAAGSLAAEGAWQATRAQRRADAETAAEVRRKGARADAEAMRTRARADAETFALLVPTLRAAPEASERALISGFWTRMVARARAVHLVDGALAVAGPPDAAACVLPAAATVLFASPPPSANPVAAEGSR